MFTEEEIKVNGNIFIYEKQLKIIEEYLKFHNLKWSHENTVALGVMLQTGVLQLGKGWVK